MFMLRVWYYLDSSMPSKSFGTAKLYEDSSFLSSNWQGRLTVFSVGLITRASVTMFVEAAVVTTEINNVIFHSTHLPSKIATLAVKRSTCHSGCRRRIKPFLHPSLA
ncbi:hypothetical protein RRG08_034915 [Elysia crispata]|uniref:Uncharacterized protein n=1 Tax=Elysia crispata TaxID=231223 RepID=A0AAE0YPM4_9GAST|nr:hypothetical protein RRG08_034915 [Elysia crispata]